MRGFANAKAALKNLDMGKSPTISPMMRTVMVIEAGLLNPTMNAIQDERKAQ